MPGPAQKAKDQSRAKFLVDHGMPHGHRTHPWTQGTNYPNLTEAGSAAYRRLRGGNR